MLTSLYPREEFCSSRGYKYSYIHIAPTPETSIKPYILFLHGFPSLAADFCYQINYFSALGYGIIAPDMIGYGCSARTDHQDAFNQKLVSQDLSELLDHHSLSDVVGVSHDFGAQILTRFEFYYPSRVTKLAFLTVGPITIGQKFDLDTVNKMTFQMLGYECFGYQEFLTRNTSASDLLANASDSFHDLVFTSDHTLWKDHFGRIGGLEKWVKEHKTCEVIPGFKGELAQAHKEAFRHENGGYDGARSWYTAFVNNFDIADDNKKLQESGQEQYKLQPGKKVILITAGLDVIAFPDAQEQMTRPYLSDPDADLTVETVNAGHWVGIERADEVNSLLRRFIEG